MTLFSDMLGYEAPEVDYSKKTYLLGRDFSVEDRTNVEKITKIFSGKDNIRGLLIRNQDAMVYMYTIRPGYTYFILNTHDYYKDGEDLYKNDFIYRFRVTPSVCISYLNGDTNINDVRAAATEFLYTTSEPVENVPAIFSTGNKAGFAKQFAKNAEEFYNAHFDVERAFNIQHLLENLLIGDALTAIAGIPDRKGLYRLRKLRKKWAAEDAEKERKRKKAEWFASLTPEEKAAYKAEKERKIQAKKEAERRYWEAHNEKIRQEQEERRKQRLAKYQRQAQERRDRAAWEKAEKRRQEDERIAQLDYELWKEDEERDHQREMYRNRHSLF